MNANDIRSTITHTIIEATLHGQHLEEQLIDAVVRPSGAERPGQAEANRIGFPRLAPRKDASTSLQTL